MEEYLETTQTIGQENKSIEDALSARLTDVTLIVCQNTTTIPFKTNERSSTSSFCNYGVHSAKQ